MSSSIDNILKQKLSHTEYEHVKTYIQTLENIAQQTSVLVSGTIEPLRRFENFILFPTHEEPMEYSSEGTVEEETLSESSDTEDNGWKLHYSKN